MKMEMTMIVRTIGHKGRFKCVTVLTVQSRLAATSTQPVFSTLCFSQPVFATTPTNTRTLEFRWFHLSDFSPHCASRCVSQTRPLCTSQPVFATALCATQTCVPHCVQHCVPNCVPHSALCATLCATPTNHDAHLDKGGDDTMTKMMLAM